MRTEPYTFKLGDTDIEAKVTPLPHAVRITYAESNYLLYNFKRANPDAGEDERNPLLKPENVSVSGALHESLKTAFGFVTRSVTFDGVELTCDCDNPMLEFDRHWSDGPSQHYWYRCVNCDNGGAVHTNHKDELTSHGPFTPVDVIESDDEE